MSEITITLTGSEVKAEYSGSNAWLRNDGTATVYAAKTAGITAGAAGVTSIPAGQSAPVYGANGEVYLLGTGSVMLIGSDYSTNPFKTSAQSGGSGADEVARAAIEAHAGNSEIHVTSAEKAAWDGKAELSDIPTTLPADGGNADTLGGNAPSVFAQNIPTWSSGSVKDLLLATTTSGFVWINNTCTDLPEDTNTWWYGIIVHSVNHYLLIITNIGNRMTYAITYNAGDTTARWNGWRSLSDGGNADTLNGLHANEIAYKPNLLINPDFAINQRGADEYSGTAGYCVDRWYRNAEASVSITDTGIGLSYSGTSNPSIYQKIDNCTRLLGKQITFSAIVGGEVLSCTGTVPDTLTNSVVCFARIDKGTSAPSSSDPHIRVQCVESMNAIICVLNNVTECSWAKLELGSVATPFVPPDPATELAKCQRYYQRLHGVNAIFASVFIGGATTAYTIIPIATMRRKPALTLSGSVYVWAAEHIDANSYKATAAALSEYAGGNAIGVEFTLDSASDAVGQGCTVQFRDDASFIELGAEL